MRIRGNDKMKCKIVKGDKDNLNELTDLLGARGKMDLGPIIDKVTVIIDDIKKNGDEAVLKYTKKFDKADLTAEVRKSATGSAPAARWI